MLGPDGQSLLIGRPANLRRWAATQLGAGPPPKKGMRPPTEPRPHHERRRLRRHHHAFRAAARLRARHGTARAAFRSGRDLKPPVYLHLDPAARFPAPHRPAGGGRPRAPLRPLSEPGGRAGRDRGAARPLSAAALRLRVRARAGPRPRPRLRVRPGPDLRRALPAARSARTTTARSRCGPPPSLGAGRGAAAGAGRGHAALGRPPSAEARGLVAGSRPAPPSSSTRCVAGAVIEEAMASATQDGLEEAVAALRWPAPPSRATTRRGCCPGSTASARARTSTSRPARPPPRSPPACAPETAPIATGRGPYR